MMKTSGEGRADPIAAPSPEHPTSASRGELAIRRSVNFVGVAFGCFLILRGGADRAIGFMLVFLNAGDAFRLSRRWQIACWVACLAWFAWFALQLIRP